MSRKGKLPIPVPKGVEVQITSEKISVKGPKGTLHRDLLPSVVVKLKETTSKSPFMKSTLTKETSRTLSHPYSQYDHWSD